MESRLPLVEDRREVASAMTPARRMRSIFSGSIGNLVEWFDWYVYAAFSLYFAHAFFPEGDQTSQLLNTAAIFAVGFLMRPVGGWLLGVHDEPGFADHRAHAGVRAHRRCRTGIVDRRAPAARVVGRRRVRHFGDLPE
jgi:MFS family permease